VKLIKSFDEAGFWIEQMFGDGVTSSNKRQPPNRSARARSEIARCTSRLLNRRFLA
jgi:hypothetical protein